ncbi:MAG: 16S rRNA (guanine(527)-N(7))-methyltransferase RsmG [Bacteroidota bacterium]
MLLCHVMEIIKKYFALDPQQEKQFTALGEIYSLWNEKINVISRKDIGNLYEHHILHSLIIAKVIQFRNGTKVLDAGTGGGFPGIPLAIMFPDVNFLLVDSVGKKITVVKAVAEEIGLKNVHAIQSRVENTDGAFDFVVSRAVTELPEFYMWVKNKISKTGFNDLPNGLLYLKGGDFSDELKKVRKKYKIYNLEDYFEEEYFTTKKLIHIY